MRYLTPVLLGMALLALWEIWVSAASIPVFILPPPSAIGAALVDNFASLMAALWVTGESHGGGIFLGRGERHWAGDYFHPGAAD
jgi:ABC-type nitrate/sulfonate/bicarbonate transport system permease component